MLIFYKYVDKSLLSEGFTIPIRHAPALFANLGITLAHGERAKVTVVIDGEPFEANLINQPFNRKVYSTHTDIVQIRYSRNSPLAKKLRAKFACSANLFAAHKDDYNAKWLASLPETGKEHLALYTTGEPGVILFDCLLKQEFAEESSELVRLGECAAEAILDATDPSARIELRTRVCKIRRLSRTISEDLKTLYSHRCQICGEKIGAPYGATLIHAHHIDYFTTSLDNSAANILIVCPNHHGIIHTANPTFNRKNLTYSYPNGLTEPLKLNHHL